MLSFLECMLLSQFINHIFLLFTFTFKMNLLIFFLLLMTWEFKVEIS